MHNPFRDVRDPLRGELRHVLPSISMENTHFPDHVQENDEANKTPRTGRSILQGRRNGQFSKARMGWSILQGLDGMVNF